MKVNRGIYKGKKLKGIDIGGTRPTMDRIKESLFSMIQDNVKNSICLDLFAGSGSLGIEALSMESKYVYFVDNNKECIKVIKDNLNSVKIDTYEVIMNDYKESLEYFRNKGILFDLIFLDPPYKLGIMEYLIKWIDDNKLLNNDGMIVCEYVDDILKSEYNNLFIVKSKKYGDKYITIFRKK